MLGGYQIINLTGIDVALNSEMTAISNRGVLIQLLALREYIEDNYNFTRPLNKKLKPVMLRLRDKESGEKIESSVWANIAVIDDNLSFNIDAIVSVNPLRVLQINVVFQKLQDEDENDYYDIKSAGYLYKGGNDVVTVSNIKNIDSDIINKLQCGDIVLKHDSSGDHAYIVSYRGATGICLTYTDASVIETQSYDLDDDEWVYNSEDKIDLINPNFISVHANEIIENMSGYSAELDNTLSEYFEKENVYTSVVKTGNKITFVCAFKVTRKASFTGTDLSLAKFTIPSNIGSKLYPVSLAGYNSGIAFSSITAMNQYKSGVDIYGLVEKNNNTQLTIYIVAKNNLDDLTLDTSYYVRVEATFLLSDNLIPQE